jgi:hypothetical protein
MQISHIYPHPQRRFRVGVGGRTPPSTPFVCAGQPIRGGLNFVGGEESVRAFAVGSVGSHHLG